MSHAPLEGEPNLGPLVKIRGDELWLRGWRSISLINIAAVGLPLALGIWAFIAGGWWRVVSVALIAFVFYGCWAIFRGATAKIRLLSDGVLIDWHKYLSADIDRFDGRRVREPSQMDGNESGTELWLIMLDGSQVPVIQMSGYARIETIASHLNQKLQFHQ